MFVLHPPPDQWKYLYFRQQSVAICAANESAPEATVALLPSILARNRASLDTDNRVLADSTTAIQQAASGFPAAISLGSGKGGWVQISITAAVPGE
jgi:hypothetical protein